MLPSQGWVIDVDLMAKLQILGDAAKYDVSCASSGAQRKGAVGATLACGICHSWSADGRCVSLLKVLMSNACVYDCAYCQSRRSNDVPRASFTPEELAELTIAFYRRNYIEGLFLSSGVLGTPDATMERMIRAIEMLRYTYRFSGYVHMKVIPGADPLLIERAGRLCDRISVNIELPSEMSLQRLAPDKGREAILTPMKQLSQSIVRYNEERRSLKHAPEFAATGQSTQLIVGASPENDRQIALLSQGLYRKYRLKRVYFSAYVPVNKGVSLLPDLPRPPLLREHRLYQTDWLMRLYGFTADEVLPEDAPNLDTALDPKAGWALRNLGRFPVDINAADMETLLRVPGIGFISAERIVRARRIGSLSLDDLKGLGVVLKRAKYFVMARGRGFFTQTDMNPVILRELMARQETNALPQGLAFEQLSFLEEERAPLLLS